MVSKLSPKKKAKKRALIYGLVMVAKELGKQLKVHQEAASKTQSHLTAKEPEIEQITAKHNTALAQVLNQTLQLNQPEQQLK